MVFKNTGTNPKGGEGGLRRGGGGNRGSEEGKDEKGPKQPQGGLKPGKGREGKGAEGGSGMEGEAQVGVQRQREKVGGGQTFVHMRSSEQGTTRRVEKAGRAF
jgi:hypothetical protein